MPPLPPDYFEQICRHTAVGVLATDRELIVCFCNEAAARFFGRCADQILGQSIMTLVPAERRDLAQKQFDRILQRSETVEFEVRHPREDSVPLHLAAALSPLRDAAGAVIGVCVLLRDITRVATLLYEVSQAQKMAALESMAGAVADRFNNVLGGVITIADFAQDSDNPDLLRRTLRTTLAALVRANDLVGSLLAFAQGDHAAGANVTASVGALVQEAAQTWSSRLADRSIELVADVDEICPPLPARPIATVLNLLIQNAVEAMPDGGTLRIEAHNEGEAGILLRISDTGVGIDEQHLPRVFEPFFTTHQADRHTPSDHAGLGLPVAYGILKGLGGGLTLSSSLGGGTIATARIALD